jgi:hypothetical protein
MAVGTTLLNLRRMLRAEVGQSLNPAQGVNAQGQYDLMLDRSQRELWVGYDWPHLALRVDLTLSAGQDIYPYPTEMPFESVNQAYCWDGVSGSNASIVGYPIPRDTFSNTGRAWPVQFWQNQASYTGGKTVPAGSIRLWPIPDKAGKLVILGSAPVNALVADADVAVLDDTLITLFAAAEILAQQKSEGASIKLQKANQYLRRLLANQNADKARITILGGAQIAESMMPIYDGERRFRVPGEG